MWEICAAGFQTNKQRFGSRNFGIHSLSLLKSAGGVKLGTGSFTNYVDTILAFFDHLSPCVDIFYGINVDKKWTFLEHLPTSSCKRSL